ncbi:hypothetical protein K438DRAFT_1757140 [Mycena galopus ATCC 62051]|nr:hypothetical protein K438DRAFT_1757140 [Mycena galopus ATCC 62051]
MSKKCGEHFATALPTLPARIRLFKRLSCTVFDPGKESTTLHFSSIGFSSLQTFHTVLATSPNTVIVKEQPGTMMSDNPSAGAVPNAHEFPCALTWMYATHTIPLEAKILLIVQILKDMRLSPIELLTTLLVPQDVYRDNADGFYRSKGLENLLNLVSQDKRGRKKLDAWIESKFGLDPLLREVHHEMDSLSSHFRRSTSEVTPESLLEFNFERDVTELCREHTPKLRRILLTAVQTPRAAKENTVKDPEPVLVTMIQAQLAKTRSQNNNLCAIPCSLYFLSSGMPRKVVDTLAHAGMNLSYNSVKTTHSALANGQMRRAQLAARSGHAISWDNTHISLSVHVEQRTLAPPKVQTGTTQIVYALRGAIAPDSLQLLPILERRASAPLITFAADIRPTYSQCQTIQKHLCLTIVELLIQNEPSFNYIKSVPELQHPQYRPPPPDHQTDEFVLRTTKLDEGSGEGTIQVNDNIYMDQLKFAIKDLDNMAVPSINDQKTNALIRAARLLRLGDLSALLRLDHYQLAPGLFHVELNLSWLLLKIHRGNGADLGSLQYFIGLLAKVRLGSAQPDFETLVSLFKQVLVGAMLHFWEMESGMSLKELAKSKPSASTLLDIASRIFTKHASGVIEPVSDTPDSDNTFHNLHLLMRDLLLFHFLQTSISSGDFGRVELLLGTLTMMFSGGGCSNYQTELLYFLQNLKKVWPEPFANIMRDNALISTSGRTYVGVDKNAEFNINFQKHYFAVKGVHASWDFLADLAPNIPILRKLKSQFGEFLGAPWQGTHHTKVDCSALIAKVKSKMEEFELDRPHISGRRVTERRTIDIIQAGADNLRKTGVKAWSKSYTKWANGT